MKILVTGANGFIGRALIDKLHECVENRIVAAARINNQASSERIEQVAIGNLAGHIDWSGFLNNVDVVIHTAARVHVMKETAENALDEFRTINVQATLDLAYQASKAGVKRFVYLSSIKVNGEYTLVGQPFTEMIENAPTDPYGLSKYEAEQGLLEIAKKSKMDVVIVRPPLVYGPGVKANFNSMMQWIKRSLPLPLGAINNRRSLIALDNLLDFLTLCLVHPKAANQVFVVSDNEDVSTSQLISKIAIALEKKPCLIKLSPGLMAFLARLIRKENAAKRLFESLQIDSSKSRTVLNWTPKTTMAQQLKLMADKIND
jgi:nucleoside-diphosphate-sugar epimerase